MTVRFRRRVASFSECLEARHLLAQAFPAEFHQLADRVGAVATADFNGDGISDVVCATGGDITLTTFFGTAGGQLRKGVELYTGDDYSSLATGDFNGDGKIDLVGGNWTGPPRVLLGDGQGGFPIRRSLSNSLSGPTSVAVTDFNLDGKQDVVVGYAYSSAIAVFRGTGLGTFTSPSNFAQADGVTSIAVGDFNADGRPDLATTSQYRQLKVRINTPAGSLSAPVVIASDVQHVVTADLNNDTKLDLATGNGTYLGAGDGTFVQSAQFDSFYSTGEVLCLDVNLDGKIDMLRTVDRTDSIAVQLGGGDGTFGPETRVGAGAGIASLAAADLDADGHLDVALGLSAPQGVSLLRGSPDGRLLGYEVEYLPDYIDTIAPLDLDDNGVEDLIGLFRPTGRMTQMIVQPDGSHRLHTIETHVSGIWRIETGDLNADGHTDFVAGTSQNEVWTFLGDGLGAFEPATTLSNTAGPMTLADLNGDGRLDLVTLNWDGYLVHLGNGDGTFGPANATAIEMGCTDVKAADIDADGTLDLAVTKRGESGVVILLGAGDGTFGTPAVYPGGGDALVVRDFDSNGTADIASIDESTDRLFVHMGTGDGTFSSPVSFATNDLPSRVIAADYDRDGRLDLLVFDNGNRSVTLFMGTAAGNFVQQGSYAMPASPYSGMVSMDFDADGFLDLVATGDDWYNTIVVSSNFMGVSRAPVATSASWSVDSLAVTIRFDLPIDATSVSPSDMLVTNLTTGDAGPAAGVCVSDDGRTLTFTFSPTLGNGLLRFRLASGAVAGRNGVASAADVTLQGSDVSFLRGDLNGDQRVDFADLLVLAQNYDQIGRSYSQGNLDFSSDGRVGFDDLLILSQQYGATLQTVATRLKKKRSPAETESALAPTETR